jgi:signal transduction histidine kinase
VPYRLVTERVYRAWAAMAVFALLAIGLATVLARRQAVRLAAPLERLTRVARALGDGDFTVRAERFGVRETDTASQALEDTATQLGRLLDRERAFSSDVSHQLRTPLTALLVGLESALTRPGADPRSALRDALSRGEHLRTIVDDLVSLVRHPGFAAAPVDTAVLLADVRTRWDTPLAARGRNLVLATEPDLPWILAPDAAVRQILDVLIGNALWHGDGTVTIEARQAGDEVVIDVSDEGPGLATEPPEPPGPAERAEPSEAPELASPEQADGHGRGLPLARSLAVAAGGRLVVRRAAPLPVFSVMLPAADRGAGAHPAVSASKR